MSYERHFTQIESAQNERLKAAVKLLSSTMGCATAAWLQQRVCTLQKRCYTCRVCTLNRSGFLKVC